MMYVGWTGSRKVGVGRQHNEDNKGEGGKRRGGRGGSWELESDVVSFQERARP